MAAFFHNVDATTNANNTPVRNLSGAGDTVVVFQQATLAALGAASEAIRVTGAINTVMTLHGDLYSAAAAAIGAASGTQRIQISSTGSIASATSDAINVDAANISNAGSIDGAQDGIEMTPTSLIATYDIANTGEIYGGDNGVHAIGGLITIANGGQLRGGASGIFADSIFLSVVNDGLISGTDRGIDYQTLSGGTLSITNNGTISGTSAIVVGGTEGPPSASVSIINNGLITTTPPPFVFRIAISGSDAFDTILNDGRIVGDVILKGGNDIYDGTHGLIAGTVFGDNGGDTLTGGEGIDRLNGGDDFDTLTGNGGNDSLDGGAAIDTLDGGAGNDSFNVDDALDSVIEALGDGFDTVRTTVSYTLPFGEEIEVLIGEEPIIPAFTVTGLVLGGNEFDNRIYGTGNADELSGDLGNDRLYGRSGADLMRGGEGNDWYFVDDAGDILIELEGEGADRVFTSASYTLTAQAEIEIFSTDNHLGTSAINLTGNELPNLIYGNAGANTLDGKAGADTMIGMGGNDFYYVDNALDVVNELADGTLGGTGDRVFAAITYTLKPGSGVDILTTVSNLATTPINLRGNELTQSIFGNAGSNDLGGAAGKDTLLGLGGNDFFRFDSTLNTAPGPAFAALPNTANVDRISDFDVATDQIFLNSGVFGSPAGGLALAAFVNNVNSNLAQDVSDRIIYNQATGALIYDPDGTGAQASSLFGFLPTALATLANTDFTFIN